MDIIEEISLLTKKDSTKEWENLLWILSSECGWSQEEILNADIPFVFSVLNGRLTHSKEQEKLSKRK